MSGDPRRWSTLSSRPLIDRWWMRLRVDRVRLPAGHVLDEFHVLEYPDWACVLAVTGRQQAVLVEQYRYGTNRTGLELPAGMIEPGESPLLAAQRELREETGYEAPRWTALGRLAVEPARHTNHAHLFLAQDAVRVAPPSLDLGEEMEVRTESLAGLPAQIEQGHLTHGIHVALVFWGLRHLQAEADRPAGAS